MTRLRQIERVFESQINLGEGAIAEVPNHALNVLLTHCEHIAAFK